MMPVSPREGLVGACVGSVKFACLRVTVPKGAEVVAVVQTVRVITILRLRIPLSGSLAVASTLKSDLTWGAGSPKVVDFFADGPLCPCTSTSGAPALFMRRFIVGGVASPFAGLKLTSSLPPPHPITSQATDIDATIPRIVRIAVPSVNVLERLEYEGERGCARHLLRARLARQCQCEARAFLRFAVDDDIAAHPACEIAADGEAESGAFLSLNERAADLYERLEDPLDLIRRNSHTGVDDADRNRLRILPLALEGDFPLLGEFDRVREKIDQNLLYLGLVGPGGDF